LRLQGNNEEVPAIYHPPGSCLRLQENNEEVPAIYHLPGNQMRLQENKEEVPQLRLLKSFIINSFRRDKNP